MMSLPVWICYDTNSPASNRGAEAEAQGVPHTIYFSEELSGALNEAVRTRRVGKSTIVRIAVEQLLKKLESGQLELPLGL
jgi:hypothetical protein